jgi:hemerythrin-like domain-containing protein
MDAIKFLKEEHGKAKAAFQEIEAAPPFKRGGMWGKLRPELELHEKMEETCLYGPAAREVQGDRSLADWETTHLREVQEAEGLIKEISRLDPSDDKWLATVKKLHGALEQHIRKEEQDIWPKIERAWNSNRLDEAGRQMASLKQEEASTAAR